VKGHRRARAHTHNNIIYNIYRWNSICVRDGVNIKRQCRVLLGTYIYTAGYQYVIIIIIIWSSSFYVYNRLDDFRNDDSRPSTHPSRSSMPMSTAPWPNGLRYRRSRRDRLRRRRLLLGFFFVLTTYTTSGRRDGGFIILWFIAAYNVIIIIISPSV